MKQPHDILGISYSATEDEIKKAFRKLAHIHHPDKGGNPEKFKEVSNAYQTMLKRLPTTTQHPNNYVHFDFGGFKVKVNLYDQWDTTSTGFYSSGY